MTSFVGSVRRRVVSSDKLGTNFPSYLVMSRNRRSSFTLAGFKISEIAAILQKSASISCSDKVCPMNVISVSIT